MTDLDRVWLVAHEDAYAGVWLELAKMMEDGPDAGLGYLEKTARKLGVAVSRTDHGIQFTVEGSAPGPAGSAQAPDWRLGTALSRQFGPAAAVVLLYLALYFVEAPEKLWGRLTLRIEPVPGLLPAEDARLRFTDGLELGHAFFVRKDSDLRLWEALFGPETTDWVEGQVRTVEVGVRKDSAFDEDEETDQNAAGLGMTYALGYFTAWLCEQSVDNSTSL